MAGISEHCSICRTSFEVQFRYQMEERDGGFAYFCSQSCLEKSHALAPDGMVTCDGCAARFRVELVSSVLYLKGNRKYACSQACRTQLTREANGARLGELEAPAPVSEVEPPRAVAVPVVPPPRPPAPMRAGAPGPVQAPRPSIPPQGSPRIIAVFNHKGGTGKTTTSVSLAAGLAMQGKRVLIVDTDAQGNVGVSLDVKAQRTLYHVLVMGLPSEEAVVNVRPNLDLIPSNETLAAAELYLAGRQNRDRVLAARLSKAVAQYDYVVIDCSPSLSLLNQNALVLADSLLVPVACDYLSLVGVRQVIKTVKNVNQLLHHPVRIWGVLPTFYDARARICREAFATMQQHFGDRCLTPIRAAMKVKEAPAQGQTIFEHAAGTNAAEDYLRLVERVLGAGASGGVGALASTA